MSNMKYDLLLFQLGPVQEFIAQAAKVEDLWGGSYLLSSLVLAGARAVPGWDAAKRTNDGFVFPNFSSGSVIDAMEGAERIPTIPNRFLVKVPAGEGRVWGAAVVDAVRARLCEFAEGLPAGGKEQVDQFLQTSWAVLSSEHVSGDMKEDYAAITGILSARRNLRDFSPWREAVVTGPKDFLSGKETALSSRRGAMNLIKLSLPGRVGKTVQVRYPDDDKYIAVVAMDGDTMGARLSDLADEAAHRAFSGKLADFAREAIGIISENGGSPIYVGGDDVLAVFPAKLAVEGARSLRRKFESVVGGTASAGVAVGSVKAPLQDMVVRAHEAEHRAKNSYGRDAVVIDVYKRSGETHTWGGKWNSQGLDIFTDFREVMKGEAFKRFPYKLAALLRPYELEKLDAAGAHDMADVIATEFLHAWTQCDGNETDTVALSLVKSYFKEVEKGCAKAADFLSVFLCEVFVNRPRDAKEDEE